MCSDFQIMDSEWNILCVMYSSSYCDDS